MAYLRFFTSINFRNISSLCIVFFCSLHVACQRGPDASLSSQNPSQPKATVTPGIYQLDQYLELLQDKRVGVVVNHTSMIHNEHLVDTLISLDIDITIIFSPEHGFKGTAYNGEEVKDGVYKDRYTLRSLYGSSKKPSDADMENLDVIVFDIQDVGARFYTYISTLHYVMEASAENEKTLVVLDRPNPNAHYVDGPVMENEYKSFVGMHNVPIVYGMTIGEYALMINGEGWLNNGIKTDLQVIPVQNYSHNTPYSLPIAPSPNLPNDRAILLYPSLCLFEGSVVNEGRGTNKQFQIFGHPAFPKKDFSYTPVSMSSSKYPRQLDQLCGGVDLTGLSESDIRSEAQINLSYLLSSYEIISSSNIPFFLDNNFFEKLAGTYQLRKQIEAGLPEDQIRDSWQSGLREFNIVRNKYLLYP